MKEWAGGCRCGAVRYRLGSEPFDTGWCHCRNCQLSSGAPAMVFSTVAAKDFETVSGEDRIRRVQSSSFGRRTFCAECGTPLTISVDFQPDTIDFSVATLDEPGRIRPGFHIFWSSRVPWTEMNDGLPKYDRFRPQTRGLDATEPPA
jgi:hypothetical protein